MSEENKVKEIDRESLTSAERMKLINETEDLPEGGTPPFVLKGDNEKKDDEKFEHPFEIEFKTEGEGSSKTGNEGEGPGTGGEGGEGNNEPQGVEKIKADIWNALTEANPNLKTEYKDYDAYVSGSKANTQGTEPSPPPAGEGNQGSQSPAPVLAPEEREKVILDKTYQFFGADKTVQELLGKVGITKVPTTIEDWQELYRLDKEKSGTEFLANQVTTIFNNLKANVSERLTQVEKTMGERNNRFETAASDFVGRVEKTVKEIHPKITADMAKPLTDKMKEHFKEAIREENGRPVHPENFKSENGIPVPDGKLIYSNFLTENAVLLGNVATMAAATKQKPLREQLKQQTQNGGKSISTLGNQGHNTGSSKKIHLDNPKDRENLSSRERKAILAALNSEIENT